MTERTHEWLEDIASLRESEERLRLIVGHVGDHAIFATDTEGKVTDWWPGAQSVFGFAPDEILGREGDILFTPEDRAAGVPEGERKAAAGEGRADDIGWHVRKDGSRVFIDGVSTALHGPDGTVSGFLKIGRDATERHCAEALRKALLAELQHRVRNTLAVIRSIVRRTAADSPSVEEMASHLDGRIGAFARVQATVTRMPGAGVDLTALVEDELLAHATREGERLTINGPDILLQAEAAESFSLAVHELASNAIQHGALVSSRGKVAVSWSRVPDDAGERMLFVWEESGSDRLPAEPGPPGFGFDLFEHSLPYELDAETRIDIGASGLCFTLSMPLAGRVVE